MTLGIHVEVVGCTDRLTNLLSEPVNRLFALLVPEISGAAQHWVALRRPAAGDDVTMSCVSPSGGPTQALQNSSWWVGHDSLYEFPARVEDSRAKALLGRCLNSSGQHPVFLISAPTDDADLPVLDSKLDLDRMLRAKNHEDVTKDVAVAGQAFKDNHVATINLDA